MLRVGDVVSVGVCATRVPIVVVLVFVGALGPRVAVSVAAFVPDVAVASCPAPVVELGCMATAVLIIGGFYLSCLYSYLLFSCLQVFVLLYLYQSQLFLFPLFYH